MAPIYQSGRLLSSPPHGLNTTACLLPPFQQRHTAAAGWLSVCRRSSPNCKPTKLLGASCQLYDHAGRERVADTHTHTRSLFHRIWPSRPPPFCRRRHVVDPVVQQKQHRWRMRLRKKKTYCHAAIKTPRHLVLRSIYQTSAYTPFIADFQCDRGLWDTNNQLTCFSCLCRGS